MATLAGIEMEIMRPRPKRPRPKRKINKSAKPPYRIPLMSEIVEIPWNGLNVVSTFSGCGGSCLGYRMAGCRVLWVNEFLPAAQESYKANNPDSIIDGRSIALVQPEEILEAIGLAKGELDIFDGSPPCFPDGTSVTTANGQRPIESLSVGDVVLTHAGNYSTVSARMVRDYSGDMMSIKTKYGRTVVVSTPEHPYYCMKRQPGREKVYNAPEFYEAQCLKPGDLILEPFSIGKVELCIPKVVLKQRGETLGQSGCDGFKMKLVERACVIDWLRLDIAWLLGFYAAEGHRRGKSPEIGRDKPSRREVIYSVSAHEVESVVALIEAAGFKAYATKSRGLARRITVTSLDFWSLCSVVGDGAHRKSIPEAFFGAPVSWQAQFLEGYYSGDGCFSVSNRVNSTARKATTVSRALAEGVARMTARVFGVVAQVKQTHWAGKDEIEGRFVNMRDAYSVGYTVAREGRSRPGFVNGDGAWLPITEVSLNKFSGEVFNIEVAGDNSYVAGGFAVHNCQAFSTAGKREKGWGKEKTYENGESQCNENMFFEYIRLLEGLQPKVFIAENVRGLTIGTAKEMMGDFQIDMFKSQDDTILHRLIDAGYVVEHRVLNAANFGVPQNRVRVIFQGVRRDLGLRPVWPKPLPYVYSVRDACPWICEPIEYRRGGYDENSRNAIVSTEEPAPTITAQNSAFKLNAPPANIILQKTGGIRFNQQCSIDEPLPTLVAGGGHGKTQIIIQKVNIKKGPPPRIQIRQQQGAFNKIVDQDKPLPIVLASQHNQFVVEPESSLEKYATGREWDNLQPGEQSDKYFSEIKVHPEKPSPTICASHGLPGIASPVHPFEKRKFSIAEVKRLGGFPDDFILHGTYAQQWERVGNSVAPPFMAAIARALRDEIFSKL